MKFGIEIEILSRVSQPDAARILNDALPFRVVSAGGYHMGGYDHWKLTADSSLTATSARPHAFELVSPILEGPDGIDQIRRILDTANNSDIDASANRSCGVHVHINVQNWCAKEIASMIRRYAIYEDKFDAIVPPSRRASLNHYCRSIAGCRDLREQSGESVSRFIYRAARATGRNKVNAGAWSSSRPTIEFRHFGGTAQTARIVGWTNFIQEFANASRRLATESDAQPRTPAAPIVVTYSEPNPGTVPARVLAMASREGGASQSEFESAGIPDNSLRCAISRLRNRHGYHIETRGYRSPDSATDRVYELRGRIESTIVPQSRPAPEPVKDDGIFTLISPESVAWFEGRANELTTRNRQAA